nr:GIY-YIG nuclease family protein [uncultured Gellertiella sp.]
MTGYVEFEFDLPTALLEKLIDAIERVEAAPLSVSSLSNVPETQGIYQLFLDGNLVYIGKTDAESGLHRRLSRHLRKTMYRQGLDSNRLTFKAMRIFVFTAIDLESDLIAYYGGVRSIAWNGSGFGSNDPGRERDTTRIEPNNFDALFPIDIDRQIPFSIPVPESAAAVLARLKDALPYTLRFQMLPGRSRQPDAELNSQKISALEGPATPRTILQGGLISEVQQAGLRFRFDRLRGVF